MDVQARVKNLLTNPASEWQVIAAERTDVATLYREYIVILAAIPPVCLFLGMMVIGAPVVGRVALVPAFTGLVLNYLGALASTLVAALIIEKLAPSFGSTGDTAQALKLVAFASTPLWVGGVLYLLPVLAPLMLIALIYAIYMFYVGLTPVMTTPGDKIVPYMVVSALAIIVVHIVVQFLLQTVGGVPGYGGIF